MAIKPYTTGLYWQIEVQVAFSFEQLISALTLRAYSRFPYGESLGFAINRLLQDYFIFMLYGNMRGNKGLVFGPAWERDEHNY